MNNVKLILLCLVLGASGTGCSKGRAQDRKPAVMPPVVTLPESPAPTTPENVQEEPPSTTVPTPTDQGSLVEVISPCSGEEVLLRIGPDVIRVLPAKKGKGAYMVKLQPETLYTSEANDCEFYIEVDGTLRDGE